VRVLGVIVLYCSGLGAVNPPVVAGAQAPSSPLSNTVNPVTVTIGGIQAQVEFAVRFVVGAASTSRLAHPLDQGSICAGTSRR